MRAPLSLHSKPRLVIYFFELHYKSLLSMILGFTTHHPEANGEIFEESAELGFSPQPGHPCDLC